ncbi:S8 family serine peptidase [Bowmanella dokdonensis]|uniref:S8 family serine peptidase n=1 Tax=Bowmanella dokdonensis TaxID=751969 RepID=A0A939DSJ6_9ALTE|nr:S8 family serine peptidase [Bowmanella dokdonensis]MBN7827126.1 S8 family serine peptidase [Bowmanella dokdonensis]
MTFRKSLLRGLITAALTSSAIANGAIANEVHINTNKLKETKSNPPAVNKGSAEVTAYIVQLKGQSGVAHAQSIGELTPSNYLAANKGNLYNERSANMQAYTARLKAKQQAVVKEIGAADVLYNYVHTFNGFAARLTAEQVRSLQSHPDIAGVWKDEAQQIMTSNTPEFLGLNDANGQHTLGIKGEDVVVGIVDTGIWPENPSFADDGSYSDPTDIGWTGTCDAGVEADAGTFNCNNKLIGARYFKAGFEAAYEVQYALGEFESPRDADGHGSHTASTAAGNEAVPASISGIPLGTVTGMAPRARVAAYKVCWNSDYVSPAGVNERGCFYSDSMAAIDQAVADGVDVINYSIGGSLTDLTTPAAASMLRAANAGVFVAVSAGNDGPEAVTVGTPAPWVTNVAASTYDGTSALIGNALEVNSGDLAGSAFLSVPAAISPAVPEGGMSGDLVIAEPLEACGALTNPAEMAGKIALISRGSCAFTDKINNAEAAGATAVVVYNNAAGSPFAMGGDPVNIPGVMVSLNDGQALHTSATNGAVNVTLSTNLTSDSVTEVGNIIANFSSRGPNGSTTDIIKPDITAPGVKILAATSSDPMFEPAGESFKYLQGTSMSSPHIAGLAALLKGQHPEWTPAQIKSALMTTARQNLVKEDGVTQADPFDFGSGHAAPVLAKDPGLTYKLNGGDYLGFMCGLDEDAFVEAESGMTCAELEAAGFATEASQLNYPSIAVSKLSSSTTVSRTVTDVSGIGGNYIASIEAPAGIEVELKTYDSEGNETETDVLAVAADGTASFTLTFTKTEAAVDNEWAFGAITWTDENGHVVRSPIAIMPVPSVKIEAPEGLSITLNRNRASFPVKMLYSGATSLDYVGLVAPFGSAGTVAQDPDSTYAFNEAGLGFHGYLVPEGTQVARFSLRDSLVDVEGSDLDLYVYRCDQWLCTLVGQSTNSSSNEDVILTNPEPRANGDIGDVYITFVHGWDLAGAATTNYTMPVWIADQAESSTRVNSSRRAINGRYNNVNITASGLDANTLYMGAITFYDDEGVAQGTTVLEVQPQ